MSDLDEQSKATLQRANFRINELTDRIGELDQRLVVAERRAKRGNQVYWLLLSAVLLFVIGNIVGRALEAVAVITSEPWWFFRLW